MKIFKIHNLSTQAAMILSAFIIGLSVFLTTWIFFGGDANRQKLFTSGPVVNKVTPPNQMTPEQLKKIQEQRAAQMKQAQNRATTTTQ